MPLRAVVLLNIGPAFGGFRLAARPGVIGLDDPAAFAALESAIEAAYTLLSAHPPSRWPALAGPGFASATPRLGEREGAIDCTVTATDDTAGEVWLRAWLPFAPWPLGGWAVYEGRHRAADGTWTPFSPEELAALW